VPKLAAEVRQERRQRLIDSAWRCASRAGYRDMTVDDVCNEAGLSKGAFYGYFENKQALMLALLDDDASQIDREIERLEGQALSPAQRVQRFTRWMLERGEDAARVQLRADLWATILTEPAVRHRFAATMEQRRQRLRQWVEAGLASGEFVDVPANALASALLALADGLLLHGALDPTAFRWPRIRRALDVLLQGIQAADRGGP
jgi:AcrR family transcriptional regulator